MYILKHYNQITLPDSASNFSFLTMYGVYNMVIFNILLLISALMVLSTGVYLSIKSNFLQIRKLPQAISLITKSKYRDKSFSIAALCTIIGGNLGVGNISGTAVALKSGGPGFALWMIIVVVICSIIKYVNCYISIDTRTKMDNGYFGGHAMYFKRVFKTNKVNILFAILIVLCTITAGNFVQVNSLVIPMKLINQPPIIGGLFMMLAFLFITGLKLENIALLISKIVPIMAIAYLILSFSVLYKFHDNIIPSIKLMFSSFLNFDSFKNGMISAFILETLHLIQVGAFRGIFATDIGLGLEGIVHSAINSDSKDFKITQSLISIISPFIVVIVAIFTTLVILVTDAWHGPLESTNMCIAAFKAAFDSQYVNYIIMIIMFCFSFTTIFTWFTCARSSLYYFTNGKNNLYIKLWYILFVIVLPIGALWEVQFLWNVADVSMSLMLIVNSIAILMIFPQYKNSIFKYNLK
ncbi:sodium:alanine symporter family protein [Ehrlichia ruminantium]|uniref:Sodium:alanine symporter family protein n=2 Tax=Ehrlichia ruminantium TaxID=779 RepID=A0A0H3LZN8_EHRRW|nr:transporter [Ehrlichia ruminantium]CAI27105.1 Conserved hypothetical protein. Putative Na+/alanine symporter [Ehrlichia ruminantium str. Welgevonden]CAI28054.1 Conserved hypothetical protein. Putative Na+/alanine symporter [Ehrlichia ruminantium str. Gardel]QLK50660.1 sodium:alanine symporter family protein [Ehrlichia ruminantium]QLK51585.1 sodium:alanine symporter family protein [Ehrlichia ruminantium]